MWIYVHLQEKGRNIKQTRQDGCGSYSTLQLISIQQRDKQKNILRNPRDWYSPESFSAHHKDLWIASLYPRKSTDAQQNRLQSVKVVQKWDARRKTSETAQPSSSKRHCFRLTEPNWTPRCWPTFTRALVAPRYLLHFPQPTDVMRVLIASVIPSH